MNLNYEFDDSMSLTTASYQMSEIHTIDDKTIEPKSVDIRHFYPRSSAVMHSVPKSLMGANNVSFLQSGSADDKSINTCSTAVETLASQLNSNGRNVAKCVINALDAEQKFKVNCSTSYLAIIEFENILKKLNEKCHKTS